MNMDKRQYKKFAKAHAPKSPILKNVMHAFLAGGLICALGESFMHVYTGLCGMRSEVAASVTSVSLIFLSILATAIGIYDRIAKFSGAGTLVPITGFANAVASPAIDSHAEGIILGIGSKIFTVAGPVLLYGTLSGTLYGVIYYIYITVRG